MEDNINYMEIDRNKQLYATDTILNMDYFDWRDLGISKGWISEPFCDTHDPGFMTEEEEQDLEDGNDPCMLVFRIWEDNIEKKEQPLESLFDELL